MDFDLSPLVGNIIDAGADYAFQQLSPRPPPSPQPLYYQPAPAPTSSLGASWSSFATKPMVIVGAFVVAIVGMLLLFGRSSAR